MNNLHIYALIKTPEITLDLPEGINEKVRLINWEKITAIAEPNINIETIKEDEEKLMQTVLNHDRVICHIFAQITVLPLRFGIGFVSEENLREHLKSNYATYLQKLTELTNKAEYILKFTPKEKPEINISSELKGRAYFLAKKQQYQDQQEWEKEQDLQWQNLVKTITDKYPAIVIEGEEKKIYLLGDKNQETLILEEGEQWEINLTEGLPPYHFCN